MHGKLALRILLWSVYPLAIFFGLRLFEPRYVALLLLIALLARRYRDVGHLLAGLASVERGALFAMLALALLTVATNSETLLRLYPVTMNLGLLTIFGLTLKSPPSMIERFARLREPELPPAGVRYTHRVTQVWCAFFVLNSGLAAWTALYASQETWALYNGLIAYLLMGALFAGEWLLRGRFIARDRARPC